MPPIREIPAQLRRALLLIWLLSAPILCLLYIKIAPSPDQSQFNYMGWMATQGYPFYSGSFDMNWPGGMILQELAIRLFGPAAGSWHFFDFCLMELITIAAALFLRRAGFGLAPFVMLVLYPPIYVTSGAWMAGQRDIIAVGLLICACCAMLAPSSRELRAIALAGALTAIAVLIRPTYLSFLIGAALLELAPRQWIGPPRRTGPIIRIGALLSGFALVIGAIALAGFWLGNIDDFYQQSFLFTMSVYVGKPPQDMVHTVVELLFGSWHWMMLLAMAGLALWIWRGKRLPYPLLLLLGLIAVIALSYVVQRKGFGYHLGGVLPLLIMFAAVAFDEFWSMAAHPARRAQTRGILHIALAGMVLLAASGTAAKLIRYRTELLDLRNGLTPLGTYSSLTEDEQAKLIDIIRGRTRPDERIVLYGTAYQIPYLAQRLPAYRFITPAVEQMTPGFSLYPVWKKEVEDGLRQHQPKLILIMREDVGRDPEGIRHIGKDHRPVLNAIMTFMGNDYIVAFKGNFGVLYQRVAK